jgi:Cu+-exporting ATPase
MIYKTKTVAEKQGCYHCGEPLGHDIIVHDEKNFCCEGCSLVYDLLKENNLCTYYSLSQNPGNKTENGVFDFLNEPEVKNKLIHYREGSIIHFRWRIPSMHCSSCIWLLEKLHKMDEGILSARVDFTGKQLSLVLNEEKTTMASVASLLTRLGYRPLIESLKSTSGSGVSSYKNLTYRIGVAGFCFANIMMLSLPDYFSGGKIGDDRLQSFFPYLNLLLSLPVFFYSAFVFFKNSWTGLRQRTAVIDLPVSIGIIAMMARSVYDIVSASGPGYLDSMSGLIFFMLIGRKFQDYTFDWLRFDREFSSYFPVSITVAGPEAEKNVPVDEVKPGQTALIRNNEIIPFDSVLKEGKAWIDYSFITGESRLQEVLPGETIYAGGKQKGSLISVIVKNTASKKHLENLWNHTGKKQHQSIFNRRTRQITHWFMAVTFSVAAGSFIYWQFRQPSQAIHAFVSVLVIACACALLLSAPFTFGNILRLLGRKKIFLRNHQVIEQLANVDTLVFDKTGTLTDNEHPVINLHFTPLSEEEWQAVTALLRQSSHPLSRMLYNKLVCESGKRPPNAEVSGFSEEAGAGICGVVNQMKIKIGSFSYTARTADQPAATTVHLVIDNEYKGYAAFEVQYRKGVEKMIKKLKQSGYELHLVSGDNDSDKNFLKTVFGDVPMLFNARPADKQQYIEQLQQKGKKTLMIGDGLNDTGALLQSHAGMAVSDSVNNFTPSCDGLIDSSQLNSLPALLQLAKNSMTVIYLSFLLALLYNVVAVSVAASGKLSPVFAAILMPVSTISLVAFAVAGSSLMFRKRFR